MKKRIEHIDIAKGISIFFVAMYHSELTRYFPELTTSMSLFRMPLFFLLSGIFFSYLTVPQTFLIKKSEALLKPYFAVLLILFLYSLIFENGGSIKQFAGILYGNGPTIQWGQLWFLTHLFAIYCFTYVLFRFLKFYAFPTVIKYVILLMFLLLGSAYIQTFWTQGIEIYGYTLKVPGLPFSLDIILITSVFFIIGNLLKEPLMTFKPNLLLLILTAVTFFAISLFTDAYIDLYYRVYDHPVYATIGAFAGIYVVIAFSWYLSKTKTKTILLRFGDSSLYILIFHGFIQDATYPYLSSGIKNESLLIAMGTLSLILSVFIPLAIKAIVIRSDILSLAFLPFSSNKLLRHTNYSSDTKNN
jgi:polysaccharide biosynthesis protein PslL